MRVLASLLALSLVIGLQPAKAQDDKAPLQTAIERMGGAAKVRAVKSLGLELKGKSITEQHLLKLRGRLSIYRATRSDGQVLEVVLRGAAGFVVDRDAKGEPTQVEELDAEQLKEAGYDRDLLMLPLLLPLLMDSDAALVKSEGKAPDGDFLVAATVPPAPDTAEQAVRYTLRFSSKTGLLIGARSVIPAGPNAGRVRKVIFEGYKKVGDLLLPTEIKYKLDEDPVREMSFSIVLDPRIPATSFIKPRLPAAKGEGQ